MSDRSAFQRIEVARVRVMVEREPGDGGAAAKAAFERLERKVGVLRGRRSYGYFDRRAAAYDACVAMRDDDAAALGLSESVIAGGTYLRARPKGEPPGVYDRIGPTFDALQQAAGESRDPTRECIEFYRERDEIDLWVPTPLERPALRQVCA